MKRAPNRRIAPNVWSGIGGHMEQAELNNPLETCYREIMEETGITRNNISSLNIRYIIMRRSNNEIRQSYIYFGETTQSETIQTDEGTLFWIPENELLNREYTKTFTAMLVHFSARKPQDQAVYIGVADKHKGNLLMHWSRCEDFE